MEEMKEGQEQTADCRTPFQLSRNVTKYEAWAIGANTERNTENG
jgi:hypothetical protein